MEYLIDKVFFVSFLCGWIFLVVAALMYYVPPKEINGLYGYRTVASMKNKQQWDFAQRYSAGAMAKAAMVLIVLSLSGFIFDIPKVAKESIGGCLLIGACVYMFMATEKAIKKQFGNLKEQ